MQNQSLLEPIIAEDLEPVVVKVTAPGGKRCVLREATQSVAKDFLNAQQRATRYGPNGRPVGNDGAADSITILVAGCLFEVYKKGQEEAERPVLRSTVDSWAPTFVKKLYDRARKISRLDEDLDEESLVMQIEMLQELLDQKRKEKAKEAERAAAEKNGQHETPDPNPSLPAGTES